MSSDNIRLGFIGAGAICRDRHLPGLKKIDGIELVACCNRSEASSRAIADTWNFREVTADWRELVARDDIDAVFIGTWPYTHLEMSAAALEAEPPVGEKIDLGPWPRILLNMLISIDPSVSH